MGFRATESSNNQRICANVSLPDLEFNCRRYLNSLNDNIHNPERHFWFVIELLDQMTRTSPGGEKAKYLKMARTRVDIQNWLRPLLGFEMLQHLDRPAPVKTMGIQRLSAFFRRMFLTDRFENSGERHYWAYDWITLSDLFQRAGFVEITRQGYAKSLYEPYLEENLDVEQGLEYKPGSFYIEGRKP